MPDYDLLHDPHMQAEWDQLIRASLVEAGAPADEPVDPLPFVDEGGAVLVEGNP